jgi:hypothetical protein
MIASPPSTPLENRTAVRPPEELPAHLLLGTPHGEQECLNRPQALRH